MQCRRPQAKGNSRRQPVGPVLATRLAMTDVLAIVLAIDDEPVGVLENSRVPVAGGCAVCASACPVGAIFADDQLPSDVEELTAINARWFDDKDATRGRINGIAGSGLSIT